MHRNTLLLLIFLGIFAAIVTGVNIGKKPIASQTPEQKTPQPSPVSNLLSTTSCGISFLYPNTFSKVDIETGGTTIINPEKPGESVVVVCQKDIPRIPLPKEKMEERSVGSVSATLYHDTSAKDGTPVDKLIFTHPKTQKDVFVAGIGPIFDALIQTVKLSE